MMTKNSVVFLHHYRKLYITNETKKIVPSVRIEKLVTRIFKTIILFITCAYYLDRIPSPIFAKKTKRNLRNGQD